MFGECVSGFFWTEGPDILDLMFCCTKRIEVAVCQIEF